MNEKKIKELKKVLLSKIEQLLELIGDNSKVLHFDMFEINSSNLEEKLNYIRDTIKNNSHKTYKALILKKDIVELTEKFMNKNLLQELENEKKKLRKIRYIYMILIFFIFLSLSSIVSLYFLGFINFSGNNFYGNKQIKNIVQVTSGENLVKTKDTVQATTGESLANTGEKENIEIGSKMKVKTIYKTGDFIIGRLQTGYVITGNQLSGSLKIFQILKNKKINITILKTGFNITGNSIMLLASKDDIQLTGAKIYKGIFNISGTLEDNVIYGSILTGSIYIKPKPIILDKNEEILSGKQLEYYKKEKKINCHYTGIIKVNVRALHLRASNTKYSKNLGLLYRGDKLKVITCSKNLKADSWWYKVKVLKNNKIGWVSTIGVGK